MVVEGMLHESPGFGLGNKVGRQWMDSLGLGDRIKSPSGYMGPLFLDVERTMKEFCMDNQGMKISSKGCFEKNMVT